MIWKYWIVPLILFIVMLLSILVLYRISKFSRRNYRSIQIAVIWVIVCTILVLVSVSISLFGTFSPTEEDIKPKYYVNRVVRPPVTVLRTGNSCLIIKYRN